MEYQKVLAYDRTYLRKSPHSQVVMICGRSKGLKRNLEARFKSYDNVLILGYTKHMNEWMASSQLIPH